MHDWKLRFTEYNGGRMNQILSRQKKLLIWILVGAAVSFVEIFLIGANSHYEIVAEPVLMLALTAVLYWAVNHYKEDSRFYFAKIVVCMLIGRFTICMIFSYYLDGEEKYYALRFTTAIVVFMTVLLFCMRIIQMVYDRTDNKKIYFGYVLLGTMLAVNAVYITESIDNIWREFDVYLLQHGIALLMAVAVVIWQYQKHFKRIKKYGITVKLYLCNAVKMTIVSFLVFVFPIYELFLGY